MISRGGRGMQTCRRCQLRLSEFSYTNLSSRAHLLGARWQPNDAWRRRLGSRSTQTPKLEGTRNDEDEGKSWVAKKSRQANDVKGTGVWQPLRENTVSKHPLGRIHGFRGHRLREKRAELDVESLGVPAEVIVLRDAGFDSINLPQIQELEATEKVDILTQLDAERGLITQADVERNIEECRPKTKIVSWKQLKEIQKLLVSGFTRSQLLKYIAACRRRQEKGEDQLESDTPDSSSSAIKKRTEWMPQVSETREEFEESALRGYQSEAFTPKQLLVLLLLRSCWQLEAQEIVESIGEVELEIPAAGLELLIGGRNPPLKLISTELIANQEEKIEAFRSRGVVRITSTKAKSEAIIQEIQATLKCIRHLTIDLNALSSHPNRSTPNAEFSNGDVYEDTVLDGLAQLTETHIMRLSNNHILVSYIHPNGETHSSTKADIARRLLLTSSDLANSTKTLQTCEGTLKPLMAVQCHLKNGMSWRDQLRHWVRWTCATTKVPGHPDDIEGGIPIPEYLAGPPVSVDLSQNETNQPEIQENENPTGSVYWEINTSNETSAVVGHVLHEVPATCEVSSRLLSHTASWRSKFHPAPVNISRVFETMQLLEDLPSTSLVLRFIPSPWVAAGPAALSSFPPVEMRFTVDEITKDLDLKEVIAIVNSTASDVMLPDRVLDLNFQQQTTVQLRKMHHHQLPQILGFLRSSQLNLMRGRLEIPPRITLPIDKHLCNGLALQALQNSAEESINVEYIFGGLEYRNAIALNFKGWQLVYTSIEGGKADGRRGELSLRPRRVKNKIPGSKRITAAWTAEYIEAAYSLVDTLATHDTAPAEAISSSTPAHDAKELSGYSQESRVETGKNFRYFRENIDFSGTRDIKDEEFVQAA